MADTTSAVFVLNFSEYMDSFENTTSECPTLNYKEKVTLSVCVGISFCGLVDNAIVMRFLFFHVKKNPFTVYTLNLAVADFSLLLLLSLLMLLILTLPICSLFDGILLSYVKIYIAVGYLCHFFDLSSLGFLTAISVERCLSVLFPIWYRCRRPKRLAGITFGAVAFATCLTFSSMMLVSNLSLFIKIQRGFRIRHPGKLYIAVLINVIFFFVFAIPFSVEVFVNLADRLELFPEDTSLLLVMLNSSINPVIYFLVGCCRQRRSRCSVTAALRRVFEEKATSSAPEDKVDETTV
uniref:G-protein coupled receptors family 1 profile domain-containing protein n=1 Tax=Gallus gallus TaxID=9031 RepID=A0A8V0ZQ09_CHICK